MVEVQPLENGRYRAFLSNSEFQELLESAPHHRAKPPMQLMALSTRVGTAAEVMPIQLLKKSGEHFMRVEGKDASDRYSETKPRKIWIPDDIYNDIKRFIKNHDIGDTDPICDVQKRQLQNWVKDAAENAARRTGDEDFEKVSAHDLRRFFATHFYIRLGVDDEIVAQLGGWKSTANMYEYLLIPNDLLVHRLSKMGLTGTNPFHLSGTNPTDEIDANFDTIEDILSQETGKTKEKTKERIKDLVSHFDTLDLTEPLGENESEDVDSTNESQTQSSFSNLPDEIN